MDKVKKKKSTCCSSTICLEKIITVIAKIACKTAAMCNVGVVENYIDKPSRVRLCANGSETTQVICIELPRQT